MIEPTFNEWITLIDNNSRLLLTWQSLLIIIIKIPLLLNNEDDDYDVSVYMLIVTCQFTCWVKAQFNDDINDGDDDDEEAGKQIYQSTR